MKVNISFFLILQFDLFTKSYLPSYLNLACLYPVVFLTLQCNIFLLVLRYFSYLPLVLLCCLLLCLRSCLSSISGFICCLHLNLNQK